MMYWGYLYKGSNVWNGDCGRYRPQIWMTLVEEGEDHDLDLRRQRIVVVRRSRTRVLAERHPVCLADAHACCDGKGA